MRKLILAFIALLPLGLWGQSAALTDLLGLPFASDLTGSPRRDAIAWVVNEKGVRNIWIARAPAFVPVAITQFREDDGLTLTDLAWTADSAAVYFTRGGTANPRSLADAPKQGIWVAPDVRRVVDGHGPVLSKDGAMLAWIADGAIYGMPVGSDKPEPWLHIRGSVSDLAWSPTGRKLSFVNDRGDHSFAGVFDVATRVVTFLDPAADLDQSPSWSPDGKQVAFIRVPGSREALAWGPRRSGQPWSIRIADPATGKGREIWRANAGTGSVFWPHYGQRQLLWNGGAVVFPWEGDGWLHLYSAPAGGGRATLLTPGLFEVDSVAAGDGGIYFSSNQDDADRRHLWRVSPDGGTPQRLTAGTGIETSPASLSGSQTALIRSDSAHPAHIALASAGAMRDLPGVASPVGMTAPQPVEFTASDGIRLHAQLFMPAQTGRRPAVIFFHGGARRQMLLGWHPSSYYSRAYAFNQFLVKQGYVVLSVNYRAGTGYGMEFREALNYGATGASEFADVLAAGKYLRGRADVDSAHIGLWGGSYGGYLTALGLARASDQFAAGVDFHGVHDWSVEIANYIPAFEPERRDAFTKTAFEASPMASMKTWKSPVLLVQGDDDRSVIFGQSVLMAEALRKQGVPFEQIVFPDEAHEFLLYSHWVTAMQAAGDFLNRYLKP